MKSYLTYFLITFFTLVVLLAGFNLVVDPYDHYSLVDIKKNEKISEQSNYRLYKLSQLQKSSASIAILGDSRMANLNFDRPEYINMAYGGASLKEINKTIIYLQKNKQIKKLVIGLNYNLFRGGLEVDQVGEAQKLYEKPWLYLLSPFIFKVSFFQVFYSISGKNLFSELPELDRETFWQQQVNQTAVVHFSNFNFNQVGFEQLFTNISASSFVEVLFVIPPNHNLINEVLVKFRGESEWLEWKKTLAQKAKTLDFNYDHPSNNDAKLFKDPYHVGEKLQKKMVREMSSNVKNSYGRWIKP